MMKKRRETASDTLEAMAAPAMPAAGKAAFPENEAVI